MDQENTSNSENNMEGLPKKSGMKAPDGYFENFDAKILNRIKLESKNEVRSLPVETTSKKSTGYRVGLSIAVAASLIWAIFAFFNSPSPEGQEDLIAQLTLDEVLDFENVDDYFLAEGFSLIELDSLDDLSEDKLTSEDLYAYIIEENYSEYLLIETF